MGRGAIVCMYDTWARDLKVPTNSQGAPKLGNSGSIDNNSGSIDNNSGSMDKKSGSIDRKGLWCSFRLADHSS